MKRLLCLAFLSLLLAPASALESNLQPSERQVKQAAAKEQFTRAFLIGQELNRASINWLLMFRALPVSYLQPFHVEGAQISDFVVPIPTTTTIEVKMTCQSTWGDAIKCPYYSQFTGAPMPPVSVVRLPTR